MNKLGLIAFIVILLLAGSFYLIRTPKSQSIIPLQTSTPVEPAIISTTPKNTSTPEPSRNIYSLPTQFTKRQFTQTDDTLFNEPNFFSIPLSILDSELVGMKCSPYFQADQNQVMFYTDSRTNKSFSLDPKLSGIISNINKTLKNETFISAVDYCETDDNRTILNYEIWGGGGGSQNTAYINTVSSDLSVSPLAKIPNDGAAYFECPTFLELTNKNILYVRCGGADGGGGGESIYSIDLNTKSLQLVKKCVSNLGDVTCNP